MVDIDGSLASHVYDEDQAEAIYDRIKQYYPILNKLLNDLT